jgi:hypothetical protein
MERVSGEKETQGTLGRVPLKERPASPGPRGAATMPRVIRMVRAAVMKMKTTIKRGRANRCTTSPAWDGAFSEFTTVHFQQRSE